MIIFKMTKRIQTLLWKVMRPRSKSRIQMGFIKKKNHKKKHQIWNSSFTKVKEVKCKRKGRRYSVENMAKKRSRSWRRERFLLLLWILSRKISHNSAKKKRKLTPSRTIWLLVEGHLRPLNPLFLIEKPAKNVFPKKIPLSPRTSNF